MRFPAFSPSTKQNTSTHGPVKTLRISSGKNFFLNVQAVRVKFSISDDYCSLLILIYLFLKKAKKGLERNIVNGN